MDELALFKHNFQSIYKYPRMRTWCAANLINNGTGHFESTYVFRNSGKLKSITEGIAENKEINIEEVTEFTKNSLIDDIKICLCFENYFKALLLMQNFIVHNLVSKKLNGLGSDQRHKPMEVGSLNNLWIERSEITEQGVEFKSHTIEGIIETTISLSTILNSEEYCKHLGVSEVILRILNLKNKSRNKLHLHVSHSTEFTLDTYEEFLALAHQVSNIFDPVLTKLQDQLGLDNEARNPKIKVQQLSC